MASLKLAAKNYKIEIISAAIVYGLLLIYFTGYVVYKDHQELVSKIGTLKGDIQSMGGTIKVLKEHNDAMSGPKQTNLTGILELTGYYLSGPPKVDKSLDLLPLTLSVSYNQRGERPIEDVFTYEIVKVMLSGSDASFLKSSRIKAKTADHNTRIKGIDLGVGRGTMKNIDALLLARNQIPDIENDKSRIYYFFYASWKDSLNQPGSLDKCFSMAVPRLGILLNTFESVQISGDMDNKSNRCEEPR